LNQLAAHTLEFCVNAIGALAPHERVEVIRELAKRFNAAPLKGWGE
jgi:hypothetical protein